LSTATRDLASHELWDRSLDRSRRRRVLAEDARKTISRRRQASLAVSAAMATTPVIPSVIAGAMSATGKDTHKTKVQKPDTGTRILLKRGAVSPSVATLQRRLNVPDDGYYGPVTEKAVKKFQKKHHLAPTGMVDVKTWLKLFPDGMVIYAPHSGVAQMAAQAPQNVLRSASSQSDAGVASVSAASAKAKAKAKAKAHKASLKKASAGADVLPSGSGSGSSVGIPSASGSSGSGGSTGGGGSSPAGGSTIVPSGPFNSASEMIAAMIAAANKIDSKHYAYSWGGGHNMSFSGPYDCSGAVSAVLHAAGLLNRPMVSGEFMHWGNPGRGAVTIYANAGHVYMSILGHFFGTTHANPGGGAGWFAGAARPGFVVVHVPFESMRFSKAQVKRAIATQEKNHRKDSVTYKSVTPGFKGQAPGTAQGTTESGGMATTQSGGYAAAPQQQAQTASTAPAYDTTVSQATGGATAPTTAAPAAAAPATSGLSSGSSAAGTAAGATSGYNSGSASSGAGTSAASGSSSSGVGSSSGSSSGGYSGAGSASSGSSGSTPALKDEATSTAASAGASAGSAASSAGSTASSAAAPAKSAAPAAPSGSSGSSGSGSSGTSGQ
jgi:peptidoglycan hydrolase-like protein with peptidoglycan-binding domain